MPEPRPVMPERKAVDAIIAAQGAIGQAIDHLSTARKATQGRPVTSILRVQRELLTASNHLANAAAALLLPAATESGEE